LELHRDVVATIKCGRCRRYGTLGITTNVETAGSVLGIGRSKAYEMAKADEFPVRLVRIGRRYVVPVAAILRLLGAE